MSKPLWKRIELPTLACKPNCGECCGVVPCKESEFLAVQNYAAERGIQPLAQGTTCPFFQGGDCKVYPVRPHVCRMFGHCEGMTCPHGINVNMPTATEKRISDSYGLPTRFLHELAPGGLEALKASL